MTLGLRDLYGDILLEHNRSARNRRELPSPPAARAEGDNPLCGDRIAFFVRITGGVAEDASYQGTGCAISIASASMACDAVRGKPVGEVRAIADHFLEFLTGADSADELPEELAALSGVRAYPMRVKCATLAWRAMLEAVARAEENES